MACWFTRSIERGMPRAAPCNKSFSAGRGRFSEWGAPERTLPEHARYLWPQ
jgi:hypothetical protein